MTTLTNINYQITKWFTITTFKFVTLYIVYYIRTVGLFFQEARVGPSQKNDGQLFIQYQFNQFDVKTVYDINPLKMEKQVLKEDYFHCDLQ